MTPSYAFDWCQAKGNDRPHGGDLRGCICDFSGAASFDWFGLGLLAVPCMLISVNFNLLNLALPALAGDLVPSTTQLLWISDIYVFMVAGLLLPMGLLADRFGRPRLLLIGAAVVGMASMGAALAMNPTSLIVCRGLIGVGSAMLAPSTLSLIRSMFQVSSQRAVALGIWTESFALGTIRTEQLKPGDVVV